ncbi:MAG: MinD/ParA family protein, partial [Mycobacterium sp.]|nr:MinD/ParA family protein [Mycobacterium sp.]
MSDLPGGFRGQQRFVDPAAAVPAEWTAPTPPEGFRPVVTTSREPALPAPVPSAPPADDPPPYLDLSTVALLGKARRAPSAGWRKWLYWGSARLVNLGESPKV